MQGITNKHTKKYFLEEIVITSKPCSTIKTFTKKDFVKHLYWLPITSEHFTALELKSFRLQNEKIF